MSKLWGLSASIFFSYLYNSLYLSVFISASFFALSILTTAWWLIFLWLIPIYLNIDFLRNPFLIGFLWGFWFYFLHSFTFFLLLFKEGIGQQRLLFMLVPFIFIAYAALYSGIWFYLLHKVSHFKQKIVRFFYILLVTMLYFWVVDTYLLSPFGVIEGYPLVFPLVAFAQVPKLLYLLPVVGKWFLIIFIVIIQLLITDLLLIQFIYQITPKKIVFYLVFLLSLLLLFFIGFVLPDFTSEKEKDTVKLLNKIVVIVPSDSRDQSPYQRAQELCQKMEQAQKDFPIINFFFAPESAFPFCLHEYSTFISMWTQNVLQEDKYFFCGAHLKEGKNVYNNVVLVNKCRIIQTYVKSHLIPFFERIVALPATINFFNELFLMNKKGFSYKNSLNNGASLHSLPLFNEFLYNPYSVSICSELLFFNEPIIKKIKLRIIFMKLNRFNNTPWEVLIKNSIQFKLILDNIPSLIISDKPYFYKDLNFTKIKKI